MSAATSSETAEQNELHGLRIVVIEDHESSRLAISSVLRSSMAQRWWAPSMLVTVCEP